MTEMREDVAATNSVGGGNIAGLGVGPQGEPGISKSVIRRKFAGNEVFEVSNDIFNKCIMGKKQYAKYETYVGNEDVGQAIREYGLKNRGKAIVVQDEKSGAMMFLRYGRRQ